MPIQSSTGDLVDAGSEMKSEATGEQNFWHDSKMSVDSESESSKAKTNLNWIKI